MIDGLKPYPAMKDSGLRWVGKVPEHWSLTPNRSMLRRRKVLVGNRHTNYTLLSLTKAGVVIRDVSTGRGKFSADMGTSQEVRGGDLVFCLFDVPETPRTVGLSRHNGMITGAYSVFECDDPDLVRFLETFYIAMDDSKALSPLYSGLRNTIPPSRFLGTKTPIPPKDEQTAIVRFLDHADRRIQRYLRAKEKLIALLEEQKQAITHQAVTGQIDVRTGRPYPAYKDSGVEWLGEVPEHWEVIRLKSLLEINRVVLPEDTDPDYTFDYIDIGSVATDSLTAKPKRLRFENSPSRARRVLRLGDTIVSTVRTYLKAIWHVDDLESDLIASTGFAVLTPRLGTFPKFVSYVCLSDSFTNRVTADSVGIAYPAIPETRLATFEISAPPFSEQTAIVRYLDKAIADIDTAVDRSCRRIELVQEYRTRLIADVVTGKLDVRQAAAALPEVDPRAEDEVDDPIHGDGVPNPEERDTVKEANL